MATPIRTLIMTIALAASGPALAVTAGGMNSRANDAAAASGGSDAGRQATFWRGVQESWFGGPKGEASSNHSGRDAGNGPRGGGTTTGPGGLRGGGV